MGEEAKIEKNVILKKLIKSAVAIFILLILLGALGQYRNLAIIMKEAEGLSGQAQYAAAIDSFGRAKNNLLAEKLGIKKTEIEKEIEKNQQLLEDEKEFEKGTAEFNAQNWDKAKEFLSLVSTDSPLASEAEKKIEQAQTKIINRQIEEAVRSATEETKKQVEEAQKAAQDAQRKIEEERQKRIAAENKIKSEGQSKADVLPQELMKEIMSRVAKVICGGIMQGKVMGSGFILPTSENGGTGWGVLTNAHVTLPEDLFGAKCSVGAPSGQDYIVKTYFDATISSRDARYPQVDYAILYAPKGTAGFKPIRDVMPFCKSSGISIGDQINIFGYPAFGGESMTVTDGIISGIQQTQWGPIYKTSAKIDRGNSGGIAIDVTNRCILGMPTWGVGGTFEGLGYIQSWEMMNP